MTLLFLSVLLAEQISHTNYIAALVAVTTALSVVFGLLMKAHQRSIDNLTKRSEQCERDRSELWHIVEELRTEMTCSKGCDLREPVKLDLPQDLHPKRIIEP